MLCFAFVTRQYTPSLVTPSKHYQAFSNFLGKFFATAQTSRTPLPPRVNLRPYQEECIQAVLGAFRDGRRQVGVSLATGSGKTVIFTELIDRVPPLSNHGDKTLILVHRRELVEQAARQSTRCYPDKSVEIEMGSLRASGLADITVASVQSITSGDRIDKFNPRMFKLILVDEAHHIVSPAYLRVLNHFGLVQGEQSVTAPEKLSTMPALLGVSATLSRLDGLALGKVIKHIVFHKDYIDMIGEKWLCDVVFTTVASHADLSHVKKNAKGDFVTSSLSTAVNTEQTNLITIRAWQHRAAERQATIVFCVDVNHVITLTNTFRAHGIDARFVTGTTNKARRSERLDDFRNGRFPVLINCGVFTEGTDIPNIDCVLLARPTKSRNLLVQMIGRGMRLHPGKRNCHVIDMVASLKTGIVTTPTLFGLDPVEIVHEMSARDLHDLKARKENEILSEQSQPSVAGDRLVTQLDIRGTMTFTDYDSVTDLIEDSSGERHIRAISPNAWVHVGNDRYVLINGAAGSYLVLLKIDSDAYEVKVVLKLQGSASSSFMRPRVLLSATTFEAAVHGADTYAAKHFTRILIATFTRNGWRNSPASQAQVNFLNKYRDEQQQLTVDDLNKGKAGDMITKIRFGARGRFKEVEKEKNRVAKEISKRKGWEAQKRREEVNVGPVPDWNKEDFASR